MAHSASTPSTARQAHYAVPQPMPWPIMGSASLFLMALGAVFVFNSAKAGWVGIAAGFMLLLYMMVRWFGDVIAESEAGKYGRWEDVSFRWGMSFFIFSEVMFFGAFFGALFWLRRYSVPELGDLESHYHFPPASPRRAPRSWTRSAVICRPRARAFPRPCTRNSGPAPSSSTAACTCTAAPCTRTSRASRAPRGNRRS